MLRSIRRIWLERPYYPSLFDFTVRVYDDFLWRNKRKPLPFRRGIFTFRLNGVNDPLAVRAGAFDFYTIYEIFRDGEYDKILKIIDGKVRLVVDLGANIGCSIRLWTDQFPECQVLAIEPDRSNLQVCRRNIDLGHSSRRVTLFEGCAVGSPRSVFFASRNFDNQFTIRQADQIPGAKIASGITVSDMIKGLDDKLDIDILKCDVEGAEEEIFKFSNDWIKRVRFLAIEIHHPYTIEELQEDLANAGGSFDLINRDIEPDGRTEVAFFKRR